MNYCQWLRRALRYVDHVDSHPSPTEHHFDDLRAIIDEARKRAARAGNAEAVRVCEVRQGPAAACVARDVLSKCLAACPSSTELTPPQVAERYGVSSDTVRLWIVTGKLVAHNLAQAGKRPRYKVSEDALVNFEKAQQVIEAPERHRRRKLAPIPFKRF